MLCPRNGFDPRPLPTLKKMRECFFFKVSSLARERDFC
jgi:hypothetical protein